MRSASLGERVAGGQFTEFFLIRNESLILFPASRPKFNLFCAVIREYPRDSLPTKVTKADRRPFPGGDFPRGGQ